MPQQWAFLNGRFLPLTEATVSITNVALTHGAGLFETLRAHQGRVFRGERHLRRLRRSAERFAFNLPLDFDRLIDHAEELIRRNELTDARLRIMISAGPASPTTPADEHALTTVITAGPFLPQPPEIYERGITVWICPYRQSAADPTTGHKTLSYLPRLVALREAREKHCAEALWFTPENRLAEGSISNVFVVAGGAVRTPPLDTPVLPGITREAVIELCRGGLADIHETPLTIHDLLDADEVFITNVGMGICPVARIERHPIASEKPGPLTRRLIDAFRDLVERECSPHAH